MWDREISHNMYKLWGQSSCSVHSHDIIEQYMHTVAYMAMHAHDTLSDLSIDPLHALREDMYCSVTEASSMIVHV